RLADDAVAWLGLDGAQELPARCARLELVTSGTRVLNVDDRASAVSYAHGQTIDALDDGRQVVLRPATEKTLLHVDHQQDVHDHTPRSSARQSPLRSAHRRIATAIQGDDEGRSALHLSGLP